MVWDFQTLALVGGAAFFAGLLGSTAGTGGSALLLPVLVLKFGVHEAIPMLTIANVAANLSRVGYYRRELDLPVAGWFTLGSVPLTIAGAWLFTVTAPEVLTRIIGGVLLALVAWRRLRPAPPLLGRAAIFFPLGAAWGFMAGFASAVGPLIAPFYLAYGLTKGAYIGTDALATVIVQGTKLGVFGSTDFLSAQVVVNGLVLTPFTVLGTLLGRKVLDRVPAWLFAVLIEMTLILAGLNFLIRG